MEKESESRGQQESLGTFPWIIFNRRGSIFFPSALGDSFLFSLGNRVFDWTVGTCLGASVPRLRKRRPPLSRNHSAGKQLERCMF